MMMMNGLFEISATGVKQPLTLVLMQGVRMETGGRNSLVVGRQKSGSSEMPCVLHRKCLNLPAV